METSVDFQKAALELIDQVERHIIYDAHHPQTSYGRSEAVRELVDHGSAVLPVIGAKLIEDFPELNGEFKLGEFDPDWTMFRVWLWLINDITDKYELEPHPFKEESLLAYNVIVLNDFCIGQHNLNLRRSIVSE